jgi:hypothetical protein
LLKAFKYVSRDQENIGVKDLKCYFNEEGIDNDTANMIINQLNDFIDEDEFDYKKFVNTMY